MSLGNGSTNGNTLVFTKYSVTLQTNGYPAELPTRLVENAEIQKGEDNFVKDLLFNFGFVARFPEKSNNSEEKYVDKSKNVPFLGFQPSDDDKGYTICLGDSDYRFSSKIGESRDVTGFDEQQGQDVLLTTYQPCKNDNEQGHTMCVGNLDHRFNTK